MSRFTRMEIIEPFPSHFIRESSIFAPKFLGFPSFAEEELDFSFALDLINPSPNPNPFELLDTITDLTQIEKTPFSSSYKRIQHRVGRSGLGTELYLQTLCDRVSALESSFDRLVNAGTKKNIDRKYTWTAEIKDGADRKYKWTAEIKGEKKEKEEKKEKKKEKKKEGGVVKNYKWTAEVKGKGEERPISRTYTFKASTGDAGGSNGSGKKKEKDDKKKSKKGGECDTRVVEIEETSDLGALVLRQAFAKRARAIDNGKGKKKELSPQDAALMIQMNFRAYLIRRSQALRGLRELAIAKTKLKEIRALFNNFSYRRRIAHDAEECQRFSEKIIVLLLTVDAIEGADLMVRAAKRSMVDELEAMLDAVDPQPVGKSPSMRRRTFDLPSGVIQQEIAAGVAQVVQMLDQEENSTKASYSEANL